ncbi:MAG: hypothetical protein LAO07_10525 [Acidobacteriia bacterium]|nr:hypothetical protein [Terriglobia bacterium]
MRGVELKRQLLAAALAGLLTSSLAPRLRAQQQPAADDVEEWTVPEGTEFKLQLHSTINSKTSKAGDRVLTTLIDPVAVEDREVLPKGVRIDGHVGEVKEAGRKGKGGYLYVVFDTVELPNGEKVAIVGSLTEIFSSEGGEDSTVGVEGELKGRGPSRKKQAAIIGVGTAAGAAGGISTAIAAGAGSVLAAVLLPRGKQAALTAGSLVGMRLDRDVTFNLPGTEN